MVDKIQGFKNACIECLEVFSLGKLQTYGRAIGVDVPTKKKKNELIADIAAVLVGELAPIERSTRGAPVKNDYVDPKIEEAIAKQRYVWFAGVEPPIELTYIETAYGGQKPLVAQRSNNAMTFEQYHNLEIHRGQLEVIDGIPSLVDMSGRLDVERLSVSVDQICQYGLREGDVITCHAYEKMGVWAARDVLSVNRVSVGTENRFVFDSEEVTYPDRRIRFGAYGTENSVGKYLDYILPIGYGQRCLVASAPKAGKSFLLCDMAKSLCASSRNRTVFVLLIDQSPELIAAYRKFVGPENLVATSYEDEPEKHVFAAEFLLKRAKRFTEMGRDVVLIVDSLSQLARVYNETSFSEGGKTLQYGLESKTLHYVKKYFGSPRRFAKDATLSLIASLSFGTGDGFDEMLYAELSAIANAKIQLSDSLAKRRIFPAIDFKNSLSDGDRFTEENEKEVQHLFETTVLPNLGDEKSHSFLFDSANFDEFYQKVKNFR